MSGLLVDAMESDRDGAVAEIKRLRKGIQDYLDGSYPHSRSFRPHPCPHGLLWYQGDCDQCAEAHFKALLENVPS